MLPSIRPGAVIPQVTDFVIIQGGAVLIGQGMITIRGQQIFPRRISMVVVDGRTRGGGNRGEFRFALDITAVACTP